MVTSHGARAARDVLTLWRGCYQDARLIDTPWADGERALAIVHALDFGCYDRVDGSDDATARDSTGNSSSSRGTDDGEAACRGVLLNGLLVRSPLAAPTGTYTAERATNVEGRPWVHLYRACVPDLPGTSGRRSSAQVYVKALEAAGLDMATSASLFTGLCWPVGRGLQAQMRVVTHQNVGLDPIEFARRTLVALGAAERAVRRRAARAIAAADAVTDAIEHEIDRLRTRILVACESATTLHMPSLSSTSSSVSRSRRGTGATRRKRECRDQSEREDDRSASPRRRRRRDIRRRDDCVEPVWCATHERWERASVSCADRTTTTGKTTTTAETSTDAVSTTMATQSASESTTTDSSCLAASSSSSLPLMASSPRRLAYSSSFLTGTAPLVHTSSSEHTLSSSSSLSSSAQPSCASTASSSSQGSETSSILREPHSTAAGAERAHRAHSAAGSRASQVAFDITECSEDVYSCCSECCSSSGCSCSVDGSTRDASSATGTGD